MEPRPNSHSTCTHALSYSLAGFFDEVDDIIRRTIESIIFLTAAPLFILFQVPLL